MKLDPDEFPFRFDVGEGRAVRDWLNMEGFKELFSMDGFPFSWGLLKKIAYRKGYKKEKASETIGNFIYAYRDSLNNFLNGTDNRPINCIISKNMEETINEIWFKLKKKPYHATVIDIALANGYNTMRTSRIPITPDLALLWSNHLLGKINLKDIHESIQLNPRRIDHEL